MLVYRKLSVLVVLWIMTGCQTTTDIAVTEPVDTSCQAFEPITWSGSDTAETIREVREHNAAWDALCRDGEGR